MAGRKKSQDFSHMTKNQLYEMARERNIPGKSSMNKEELIHALQKGGARHKEHKEGPKARGERPHLPGHGGAETSQPKPANPEDFKDFPEEQI